MTRSWTLVKTQLRIPTVVKLKLKWDWTITYGFISQFTLKHIKFSCRCYSEHFNGLDDISASHLKMKQDYSSYQLWAIMFYKPSTLLYHCFMINKKSCRTHFYLNVLTFLMCTGRWMICSMWKSKYSIWIINVIDKNEQITNTILHKLNISLECCYI